ncbi:MAG: hypothetical protein A2Y12_09620 [Planctomycetes bacterium GWF2_42_9]|nr:MAG: hypothetical protein A2Y12_09620 [Planctomycetes bacterium GWF2_42_9]
MKLSRSNLCGAWSASPTPFNKNLGIDTNAVEKMIQHHIHLNQKGVFIGGTCGEGPWMPQKDLRELTTTATKANQGGMMIAVQVTDNSSLKVLNNIKNAKADGADIAVVAEPWFAGPMSNVFEKYYLPIVENSTLPVGIYNRLPNLLSPRDLAKVYDHPNVKLVKDSTVNDVVKKIALAAAKKRPELLLLTGYELNMAPYLKDGYHGVLAGGGILIGYLASKMVAEAAHGNFEHLSKLQKACDKINYTVYGGKKIKSWLTGLKYALVQMGIFRTTRGYLEYPLPQSVQKRIDKMIKEYKTVLLPGK